MGSGVRIPSAPPFLVLEVHLVGALDCPSHVHHQIASVAALCQALIAHDACATVIVDGDERLVAWNASAGPAFGFAPERVRDRSMIVAGFTRGGPAIRKTLDALRGQSGTEAQGVGAPGGDITVAPLRISDANA